MTIIITKPESLRLRLKSKVKGQNGKGSIWTEADIKITGANTTTPPATFNHEGLVK